MVKAEQSIQIPEKNVIGETLSNGTTFLYSPNPSNQIVAVNILSKLASCHEHHEKAGMANLCMRLLSAGTAKHTEEEIAINLERNGAHFKAEAGKDTSSVDLMTTTHFLHEDIQTVLELIDSPIFPEDKLIREREIVRMSIMEQEDSLLTYTVRTFRKHFFNGHPYGWPNIGLTDTLDSIDRDDLIAFAHAAFDPSNLIVSVVGGSENSHVHSQLRDVFAARSTRKMATFPDPDKACPAFEPNSHVIENRESEAEYIVMGYPGCGMKDEASIAFRFMSALLGGSMDSRLFREVRDKRGLCYQVGSNYSPFHDISPLLLYTVTTPANRDQVVQCFEQEINRLKEESISDEEFHRVKMFLCGTYIMSMETNMGQAARYAFYEAGGLGWEFVNLFPEKVNQLTADTIKATAHQYLTHHLLAITTPTKT